MLEHEQWFARDHRVVPGFLTPASARTLAALLSDQLERGIVGNLAEIGTYKGKTFIGMAKASRANERVVGFDIFPADVEQGFFAALKLLTADQQRRVTAVRHDTLTLPIERWMARLEQPARFVHIDGDHTRQAILADMALAGSFLCEDALVVLDDFAHDWYPDLTEGIIDALRASRNIVPVAVIPRSGPSVDGGTKLVCATKPSADHYRSLLRRLFADYAPAVRTLVGHEVLIFQAL